LSTKGTKDTKIIFTRKFFCPRKARKLFFPCGRGFCPRKVFFVHERHEKHEFFFLADEVFVHESFFLSTKGTKSTNLFFPCGRGFCPRNVFFVHERHEKHEFFLVLYKSVWVAQKGLMAGKSKFSGQDVPAGSQQRAQHTCLGFKKNRQGACFSKVQYVSLAIVNFKAP